MRKLAIITAMIMWLLGVRTAAAAMADFRQEFEFDVATAPMPTMEELEKIFMAENRYYDRRYNTVWDLLGDFDADFYARAATYGINEKRLKWEEEDQVLEFLAAIPKEMYPYVGPMLFEIPNMSEKVLNMPGIKETKHQFPKRIAPQLQDVEDIEFLSPFLYFLLMPEMWPDNAENIEMPKITKCRPKVEYNPQFYADLQKIVPPEAFTPGTSTPIAGKSLMRTINPDAKTLLTSADIQAFARTIPAVEEWYQQGDNRFYLSRVSTMLWSYESQKTPAISAGLREMVNPCARLVQKARLIGQEYALAQKVAGEGFTLNEWAYTCDKTVKAYRLSRVSLSLMQSIRAYKLGLYDDEINKLSQKSQDLRYATMQALVSAYNAPMSDVTEVRKNRRQLEKTWKESEFRIGETSIRIDN